MNGAMLNFIATHDSFIALGIGSVVPELRQPVARMLIAAGVIARTRPARGGVAEVPERCAASLAISGRRLCNRDRRWRHTHVTGAVGTLRTHP